MLSFDCRWLRNTTLDPQLEKAVEPEELCCAKGVLARLDLHRDEAALTPYRTIRGIDPRAATRTSILDSRRRPDLNNLSLNLSLGLNLSLNLSLGLG